MSAASPNSTAAQADDLRHRLGADAAKPAASGNSLAELQARHEGRFVDFAGHRTPLHYADGIVKEHLHTRKAAGLFDVSHMNQVSVEGAGAGAALERLMPTDALSMPLGRVRYTVLTNDKGGIIDDLLIARADEGAYALVTNACRATTVNAYLKEGIGARATVNVMEEMALLALQGPLARQALAHLLPTSAQPRPMHMIKAQLLGQYCSVASAGYTGEDGFEIAVPRSAAAALAEALLADPRVRWCGLGARDSLRLEAGLCLYGSDIDESTSPVQAGLGLTIARKRRPGGEREGGFVGAEAILSQLNGDRPDAGLRGLVRRERGIARTGAELRARTGAGAQVIGKITGGGYAPSLKSSIALAYLPCEMEPDEIVYAKVRDDFLAYQLCQLPFYTSPHKPL